MYWRLERGLHAYEVLDELASHMAYVEQSAGCLNQDSVA